MDVNTFIRTISDIVLSALDNYSLSEELGLEQSEEISSRTGSEMATLLERIKDNRALNYTTEFNSAINSMPENVREDYVILEKIKRAGAYIYEKPVERKFYRNDVEVKDNTQADRVEITLEYYVAGLDNVVLEFKVRYTDSENDFPDILRSSDEDWKTQVREYLHAVEGTDERVCGYVNAVQWNIMNPSVCYIDMLIFNNLEYVTSRVEIIQDGCTFIRKAEDISIGDNLEIAVNKIVAAYVKQTANVEAMLLNLGAGA